MTHPPQTPTSRWKDPPFWLGLVEIAGGLGLSLRGCAEGVEMPPVPLLAMLVGFIVPVILLTLPGVLLITKVRARWWFQILPPILIAWLLSGA